MTTSEKIDLFLRFYFGLGILTCVFFRVEMKKPQPIIYYLALVISWPIPCGAWLFKKLGEIKV